MEPDGLVHFIHYHKEDKDEMVTLKKALVGTMSAKFQRSDHETWMYSSTERDHGGYLDHKYEGKKTDTGYTLTREHTSSKTVLRTHTKVMHIDHSDNIKEIKAFDNITMNGDAPASQRTLGRVDPSDSVSDGLVRDSIVVIKKPPKPTTLKETGEIIKDLISCVQRHENKYAPNRTHCVRNLTQEVGKLDQESFLQLSHSALNKSCDISDIKCLEERYLMIDVISQMRSNASQQILVDYVLERNASVEEVRRCLIHSIATKQPIPSLVQAVEHLCLGKNHSFHGNNNMTLTQKRACLTLGALAKNLKDINNDTEAQRIIEKFETWLGIHNEAEFIEIVKPRERRSLGRKYHDRDNHVALKRSLIHILGNAGHPRSLQHITSYMELNKANPELRRAATQALRHFTCNESAAHLIRSTLFDSEDVVRHSAYEIYVEHPESKQLTKEQEDAVLAQKYTYPMITRVRRGTLADILKALSFHLGMPKFDWSKTVGSKKLGASFGFREENFVDLHLGMVHIDSPAIEKPFKGKFELKVDNLAFAEVNVGLIGMKFDIFRVSLCYKKKVQYNLNILKDFGFDDIQNIASAFDRLFHKIIDPIVEAVNVIKELIEMVKEMTFVQLVKEIIQIFKNLPDIIHKIVESVKTAYHKLIDFDGSPLIDRFKKVINRVTNFITDVKSDVLGFYHSIADVMTVTLPFVAHEMGEGFILIKDSWKFWENPVQSFNGIEMALLKTSLGRFEVRLFADNNRTPCFHCKLIGHSSYQCKDRPKIMNERRCYNCAAIGHLANACPNEPYCSYCNINGHPRRDCESFKQDQENQGYSKHGPENIEGRQDTKLDAHSDTHSVCDNDTFSESGKNDTTDTLNVLIGASNCTRLGETNENLLNASKSGANFENFTQILDIAVQKTDSFKVDKVAICLGTNDVSKHKDDSDQINLLVTKAVAQVKSAYPESHVGLCSIIPRKGNSAQINRLNQSATSVNKFIRKLCAREDNVDYVDLEKLFFKNGTIIRSLFDKADNSGVHISTEGAQNINRKLDDFFHSPKPCVQEIHTPMDPKRKRSDGTTTPTSADRMSKRSNTEPKKA
ncbi:unnamed protein product [Mytilus edulis]|uniref:CCHC-type domain-containing protein n=1 Tax=Mytilus edulis TaxID=6550 RepID=A0A8S3Q2R1_MYTED|nr:unnamed protein product [Mytilus edulis]